jgi:hypothetical protein
MRRRLVNVDNPTKLQSSLLRVHVRLLLANDKTSNVGFNEDLQAVLINIAEETGRRTARHVDVTFSFK